MKRASLHEGNILEKLLRFLLGTEAHNTLDAGTVVPAAIKNNDLAARGKMRQVALHVHLGFFAIGWRR